MIERMSSIWLEILEVISLCSGHLIEPAPQVRLNKF